MARLVALVALLAVMAVAEANTDKGDFFIFSKSKGAAIAAVPTVAAAPADAPAPCTQVCNDKCDTVFEKSCSKVPITSTECAMVKVVNIVKQCSKKCSVVTLVPVPAAVAVSANPSAPPQTTSTTTTTTTVTTGASTVTTTPVATAVAAADAPADTPDDGAMGGKSVTITVAKGRKLLNAAKKEEKNFLPLLLMAGKGLAKMQAAKQEQQQNVVCEDVCEDVPVEGMEKQCKDVVSEVEQCTTTPKTTCVKECTCATTVASTGKSFMLPIMGKGKGNK